MSVRKPQRPVDPDYAIRVGWVAGLLIRADPAGIRTDGVEFIDDEEGNHLDAVRVHAPSGTYLVSVEREPTPSEAGS